MTEQKWCEICKTRLKKGDGIVVGLSVMHGTMKVCSQKCLDRLNAGGWSGLLKEKVKEQKEWKKKY